MDLAFSGCQHGGAFQSSYRRGRRQVHASAVRNAKRLKYAGVGQRLVKEPVFLTLQPDGSDSWRLDPIIKLLEEGAVGIIPTDSLPAVVCDLENKNAVLKLYNVMELDPKKPLSILVRSFKQISHYTMGFPQAVITGQTDVFGTVRRMLPGPYTFILPASKNLPSQMVDWVKGKTKQRKSVGVRMPDDTICQAVLDCLDGCLLSHSIHVPESLGEVTEVPDPGQLLDLYGNRGLDFIVDIGPHVATASTVVDMTGPTPELIRQGAGDISMLDDLITD